MLSICLCTWNDLGFLKILHRGIIKNTKIPYELIVHDNGSTDGTLEWLKENNIRFTRSEENLGVSAVNCAVDFAKFPYIVDINADMYPLPNWDFEIIKQIKSFEKEGVEKFTISSCLVEPLGSNPEYDIVYCGHTPETFNEDLLLKSVPKSKNHTTQYSHPITMPKSLWDEIGGVDSSYFPGYASDHDLAAKAYKAGCRNFIMLGTSRVYHFIGQTLRKLPQELKQRDGHDIFLKKWGMSVEDFREKMEIAKSYKKVEDQIL